MNLSYDFFKDPALFETSKNHHAVVSILLIEEI